MTVSMQVTIPENGQSFALIYSVEDPSNPSAPTAGVGVQVSAWQQRQLGQGVQANGTGVCAPEGCSGHQGGRVDTGGCRRLLSTAGLLHRPLRGFGTGGPCLDHTGILDTHQAG
jgi:hypothetical protein